MQKEWQVPIGSLLPGYYLYRAAVCPDGTVFFSDKQGRLAALDADGRLIDDRLRSELVGITAMACDDRGRPVVAITTRKGSHVVALGSREERVYVRWTSRPLPQPVHGLIARGEDVVALAPDESVASGGAFLHKIDRDRAVMGFGRISLPAASLARQSVSDGSLLWSSDGADLLFLSSASTVVQRYSTSGERKASYVRTDESFTPFAVGPSLEYRPLDVVNSAARLPDGRIVTFVTKHSGARSEAYLELLRADGGRLLAESRASVSEDGGLGFLIGADGNGALYFSRGLKDRSEATIVKGRLSSVESARR